MRLLTDRCFVFLCYRCFFRHDLLTDVKGSKHVHNTLTQDCWANERDFNIDFITMLF